MLFYKSSDEPLEWDIFISPILLRRNGGLYDLGKLVPGKLDMNACSHSVIQTLSHQTNVPKFGFSQPLYFYGWTGIMSLGVRGESYWDFDGMPFNL